MLEPDHRSGIRRHPEEQTVTYHDLVSLSFVARERLERRRQDAEAERLVREISRTDRRHRRRLIIGRALAAGRRAAHLHPRLEA
jgi:hypothetical protein